MHLFSVPLGPSLSLCDLCSGSSAEARLTAVSLPAACSMPLGMETGAITDSQISASSLQLGFMGLQRWGPELARLRRTGLVNAWTASNYDRTPWIQVWKGWPWGGWHDGRGEGEMSMPAFGDHPGKGA